MDLKQLFISLVLRHSDSENIAATLWQELSAAYSGKNRHYHNLTHLENLYVQLLDVKSNIFDWDTLLFSLFYHDVVYSASSKDNEEKSAALAVKHLNIISYPESKVNRCQQQILATKQHNASADPDTNYFTDADLCILGASPEAYKAYCNAVRKEYSIYPDFLYRPGRKKALLHFLDMEKIFKTNHFQNKFELPARANLEWEIGKL